jgi:mono/diheme cytochrome c family protein
MARDFWRQAAAVGAAMVVFAALGYGCASDSSPSQLKAGRDVYGDSCSSCHGSGGQGGSGPSLATVTEVWPRCADQIEWITLGSKRWADAYGPTYGPDQIEITGAMPAHEELLTTREIAEVAAWERVTYGGGDPDEVLADCGLAD